MHLAALTGQVNLIRMFIQAGANKNLGDQYGASALHLSCVHTLATVALIQAKADVNQRDKEDRTPLHYAACKLNVSAAQALLEAKADVNSCSRLNRTPLFMLCEQVDIKQKEKEKDKEKEDEDEEQKYIPMVQLLLKAGTDISINLKPYYTDSIFGKGVQLEARIRSGAGKIRKIIEEHRKTLLEKEKAAKTELAQAAEVISAGSALRQHSVVASPLKAQSSMDSKQLGAVVEYAAMLLFGAETEAVIKQQREALELFNSKALLAKLANLEKIRNEQAAKFHSEKAAIEAAIAESIKKEKKEGAPKQKSFAEQLADKAAEWGLETFDVPRQGNCFFDACLDQLQQRQSALMTEHKITNQSDLRKIASFYLVEHWKDYEGFVEGNANVFIEKMIANGTWGEALIMNALASALGCVIVVIRHDNSVPNVIKPFEPQAQARVLIIGYEVGLHYQSLRGIISAKLEEIIKKTPVSKPLVNNSAALS